MIVEEVREYLCEVEPEAVLFDNPSFDNSIVGTTDSGGVVYDYELMVEELMKDDECSYDDAVEFIDFNTLRAIPYTRSEGVPPTVLFRRDAW